MSFINVYAKNDAMFLAENILYVQQRVEEITPSVVLATHMLLFLLLCAEKMQVLMWTYHCGEVVEVVVTTIDGRVVKQYIDKTEHIVQ